MGMNLVTGASSGIGRSLARRLAADGDPVAVLARRIDLLEDLVAEIERAGGRALAIACDVTDRDAVHAAVRRAEEHFGPTERLVANAGGGTPTAAIDFSAADVAAVLDLNVVGVAHCIEAVLPGMLARRRGHIVATSSLAGSRGLPGAAAYSAAKGALTNLMESLRMDLRPHGIDVTVIAPGFVRVKGAEKGGRARRNKPLQMELEPATALMHRAILARKSYYAFPPLLVALVSFGRLLPCWVYDRLLVGRGPKAKQVPPSATEGPAT
jgi:NAD(P)-dependent dehydrogenase (short-subunit alcohol dehydrogenase family)